LFCIKIQKKFDLKIKEFHKSYTPHTHIHLYILVSEQQTKNRRDKN